MKTVLFMLLFGSTSLCAAEKAAARVVIEHPETLEGYDAVKETDHLHYCRQYAYKWDKTLKQFNGVTIWYIHYGPIVLTAPKL